MLNTGTFGRGSAVLTHPRMAGFYVGFHVSHQLSLRTALDPCSLNQLQYSSTKCCREARCNAGKTRRERFGDGKRLRTAKQLGFGPQDLNFDIVGVGLQDYQLKVPVLLQRLELLT